MAIDIISRSISMKVWDQDGIELRHAQIYVDEGSGQTLRAS